MDEELPKPSQHEHEPSWTHKILRTLENIEEKLRDIMATEADILAGIDRINTEVTAVGALITELVGKIGTGMTQAEVDDVQGRLTAAADALALLEVDPTAPKV